MYLNEYSSIFPDQYRPPFFVGHLQLTAHDCAIGFTVRRSLSAANCRTRQEISGCKRDRHMMIKTRLRNLYLLIRHFYTITWRFKRVFGYLPNLADPVTFSEKIQWRKIYQRNPKFIRLLDKLEAQKIVGESGIDVRIPRVYWQGSGLDESSRPTVAVPYVLKTNHGCGFNSFVEGQDQDPEAFTQLKSVVTERLRQSYGQQKGEWAYRFIQPKVYAEEWITTAQGGEPVEYKFFVFDGRVEFVYVIENRFSAKKSGYFDRTYTYVGNTEKNRPLSQHVFPQDISHRIGQVEKLARSIALDYVRIDFLVVDGEFVFNEFSVYCRSGFVPYTPKDFDRRLGEKWRLAGRA